MNLLHFLSVSQSFSGVKETPNYRMTRGGWLPRFDASGPAGGATELALESVVSRPRELPAAKPATGSAPPAPATAPVVTTPMYRSSARATERLRQAELSLDLVEVVRNDLSDSDFEIVRKRPSDHVVERTTSTFAAIERFGGRGGLNWLTSRFFRLGRTQV
jgi:hypothetical protein